MFKTVQEWFTALQTWFTGTTEVTSREAIETALNVNEVRAFYNVQNAQKGGPRGRFAQILRGGEIPADRPEHFNPVTIDGVIHRIPNFVPGLPAGLDYAVDEWEGPGRDGQATKGWTLRVYDTVGSHLRIDSDEDSDWAWIDPPVPI